MSRDIIVAASMFFILAIGVFMGSYMFLRATTVMSATPPFNESFVGSDLQQGATKAVSRLDVMYLMIFVGIMLGLIGAGYFLPANPLFFIVYFFCLLAAAVISPFLTNTWNVIATTTTFSTHVTVFPVTNFIMNNLIIFVIISGAIGMVIMFTKPGRGKAVSYR